MFVCVCVSVQLDAVLCRVRLRVAPRSRGRSADRPQEAPSCSPAGSHILLHRTPAAATTDLPPLCEDVHGVVRVGSRGRRPLETGVLLPSQGWVCGGSRPGLSWTHCHPRDPGAVPRLEVLRIKLLQMFTYKFLHEDKTLFLCCGRLGVQSPG